MRSCVLARRWCHLWRSLPVLRVTSGRPVQDLREFLDQLLLLRDRSPLDACLFEFEMVSKADMRCVSLWIRYAFLCQVKALTVACSPDSRFHRFDLPLPSQSLTSLKLHGMYLKDKSLDFSNFPALDDLELTKCIIATRMISSRSLKRLNIGQCFVRYWLTRIAVPSLISLQLTDVRGRIPLLEEMPDLVTATVTVLETENRFYIPCGDTSCQCCLGTDEVGHCGDVSCQCCYGTDHARAGCMLLNGLSAATNLKLIAESDLIVTLKRDLRHCPTFSKLKTLFLNEWVVAADHDAIVCILQHSPVLENLTIQLSETPIPANPLKVTYNLLEQSVASENLKVVEIACQEVDQRVNNIMKSLSSYGIPLEKINIRQTNKSS